MVMPRFITSISFSPEFLAIWEKLKDKARQEGKPLSTLLEEILSQWVKDHLEGNPSFPLNKWLRQPDFRAMPTLGEDFSRYPFSELGDRDLIHIIQKARECQHFGLKEARRRELLV